MPPEFGYFTYKSRRARTNYVNATLTAKREAERLVGRIDAIVFPELALHEGEEIEICTRTRSVVIGGTGSGITREGNEGRNRAVVAFPIGPMVTSSDQPKHHRWRLDQGQIRQYGLGGSLDPTRDWWECIELDLRVLNFYSMAPWLTLSVLICEDLARQDPVAELVRTVGPNLIIAPLLDGPQLAERWPARYATVLADDPGTSVLTLSSIGMVRLCRPPGKPESRKIALWKDAISGVPIEIELAAGAIGVVLCVTRDFVEEWTADGRSDKKATAYLLLNGVHQVFQSGKRNH
jgi:hypothetical protein